MSTQTQTLPTDHSKASLDGAHSHGDAPVISTTSTFFPLTNSTSSYPTGTGVSRSNSTLLVSSSKATATSESSDSGDSTATSTSSAASSSSTSGAAPGVQAMQGGLLLGALGALVMMV